MITKLTLYRDYKGRRIPVVIEYDESMTIIPPRVKPNIVKQAQNIVQVAASESKSISKGDLPVTEEEIKTRMDICKGCELFIAEKNRCSQCGCFMKLKSRLRSQNCPVGKW